MTSALGLLVRRSLRTNRRAVLGLSLVIALAGAVALTSVAGARRTASAFPRYLDASNASDVSLNVVSNTFEGGDTSEGSLAATTSAAEPALVLPGIESQATYLGLEDLFLVDDQDQPLPLQGEVVGSLDGRFFRQDRLAVLEGRLPDESSLEEVAINRASADVLGLSVGSTLRFVVADLDAMSEDDGPSDIVILNRGTLRVVGIGLFPEEVLSDDFDGLPRVLTSPAFTERHAEESGSYSWTGLRLHRGTTIDAAIRDFEAALPEGYQVNVQRTDTQLDRVERSLRPVVIALGAFGATAGLATLVLGALGAVRLMAGAIGPDAQVHRALGVTRAGRQLLVATPGIAAIALGVVGAVALAVVLSPLSPIGAVREVEPERGVDVDAAVLLLGGGLLLTLLVGISVLAGRRAIRPITSSSARSSRPSRVVTTVAGAGLGPVAVVGAGHALGAGGRDGVPMRATLAACAASVIAIVSALTFGASVTALVDTPASYGWAADLAIHSGGGYDYFDPEASAEAARTPGVEALSVAGFGSLTFDDHEVNVIGLHAAEGDPIVTLVRGSLPDEPTEVALGASTARDLDAGPGDVVAGDGGDLDVVGIVALPAIGPAASAHPSLGQGALMTLEGLVAANENAYPSLALVRVAEGVDVRADGPRLMAAVAGAMSESPPEFASTFVDLRPSEVVGLEPASRTAHLLAALLGAAAVLALLLTLGSSVRRRRSTYSMLSALGFDQRELRRTVRWELNIVTLLALLIGLPAGIVVGRLTWRALAEQLGAAGEPSVPVAVLGSAALGLLLVCNLVGELPARTAGRRRSSEAHQGRL